MPLPPLPPLPPFLSARPGPVVARLALGLAALAAPAGPALGREQIQIAGSSTVLPYASIAAEAFAENFDYPTPVVESGGSSAGLKRFCQGLGENQIDIANASRPMRPREIAACAANGVEEIIEVRFGYDGIVLASDRGGPGYDFSPADWFLALAARVPVGGALAANPYRRWAELNPALPDRPITAFIPGTKHGTREVFEQKVILQGCRASGAWELLLAESGEEKAARAACLRLRTDGLAVDIDGDYTETLARIATNPDAIGVFGLSFYENNAGRLRVARMGGVTPSAETVASGAYPVSRPLFFYVKKAHLELIPGLDEFVAFFVDDEIAGPDGPLAEYGLVADPELARTQAIVAGREAME